MSFPIRIVGSVDDIPRAIKQRRKLCLYRRVGETIPTGTVGIFQFPLSSSPLHRLRRTPPRSYQALAFSTSFQSLQFSFSLPSKTSSPRHFDGTASSSPPLSLEAHRHRCDLCKRSLTRSRRLSELSEQSYRRHPRTSRLSVCLRSFC